MASVLLPLGLVAAALALAAVAAYRRPVVFRMAARNATRRKRQTLVVIAGLMVGTAIIAGSLATGDSLAYSIRKGAYDGLGPADEFLRIEGQLAFPQELAERVAADPEVQRSTHALSPLLVEEASAGNAREKQSEPQVPVIGFDPALDRPFGLFHHPDGSTSDGSELGADEVYVHEALAEKLSLAAGDPVTLRYSVTPAPVLPRIYAFNGTLAAGAGACPAPGGVPGVPDLPGGAPPPPCAYPEGPVEPATFAVPVGPGAVRATAILTWFGPNAPASDLDPVFVSPSGERVVNANGTPGRPDIPAILNLSAAEGERELERGEWTFQVAAKAAADQPFTATVLVFYEVYDLQELRNVTRELEARGFTPADFERFASGLEDGPPVLKEELTVRGVVTAEGKGDFLLGENVFMRLETAQRIYDREGRVNLVQVTNDGSVEGGVARTDDAVAALEAALARARAAMPDDPAAKQVQARDIKAQWLEASDEAGNLFKQFLTTIGSFTIVAGVMLIVNIFVMLAEERKSELGMARAVGLTRRQLVLLFGFEGLLYAAVASVIGVLLGLVLSFGLIWGFNSIVTLTEDSVITSFPFRPEAASLAWALASGFFITMLTVALASHHVSKLNVVRAIRRIEEPKRPATGAAALWGAGLALVGVAGTAQGVASDSLPFLVLAPSLALIGLSMTLTRWFERRIVYPVAGAVTAAYATWTIFELPNPEGLVNQLMGPARGVIIVIAVVLIVVHVPQIVALSKRVLMRARHLRAAVKPGIAYPLEKKTRTGLTIAMFALVILVVVAFSIFAETFRVDLQSQSGGYDVEGDSTVAIADLRAYWEENGAPGAPDPFANVSRFDALRYAVNYGGEYVRIGGEEIEYQGPPADWFYSYDADFATHNRFELEERLPEYASDEAAYRAVLDDPTLVIISSAYTFDESGQPGAHSVGETLTLHTAGGGEVEFTVIGIQKQFYLAGVWVNEQVLEANFQRIRGEYLFKLDEGADPRATARTIEAAFEDLGMDAKSIEEEAAKRLEASRRFFTLFQLFLAFGLVVGIASLGIVTARSVIERRQEIGMLRAIGYPRAQILRMFLIEVMFTTTLGVLIGSVIGFLVSYGVVTSTTSLQDLGVTFRVPWLDLALIIGLTYVAVLVATFFPARAASRVPPAEAVRYIE